MDAIRHNNFDAVRLTAALAVLVSHQHALTGLNEPYFAGIHSWGSLAVAVFFSISGFLVAASWRHDPHVMRFAARRALRIWPALAVVVLLTAFVIGPLNTSLSADAYFTHKSTWEYLRILAMKTVDSLPSVRFEGSAIPTALNGSLWSIPLEVRCYIVLCVIGMVARRWLETVAVVAAVGMACAFFAFNSYGKWITQTLGWGRTARYLLEFGLYFVYGVVLQWFAVDRWAVSRRFILLGTAFLAAGIAWTAGQRALGVWLVLPILAVLAGTTSTPVLRRAGRWGDVSYGAYLYAFPVQQLLISGLGQQLPWAALLALTIATTLASAFASWHLVEKPALRLKPAKRPDAVTLSPAAA